MRKLSFLFVALLSFGAVHSQTLVDGFYYNLIPDFDGEGTVAQIVVPLESEPYTFTYRGDITIPSSVTIEGTEYPVTSIDCGRANICPSSIYIPKTVKYIFGYNGHSWVGWYLEKIVFSIKETKYVDKVDGTIHDLDVSSLGLDQIIIGTAGLSIGGNVSLTILDDTIGDLLNILAQNVKVLHFTENLKSINLDNFSFEPYSNNPIRCNNLDSIIVDANNPYYSSVEGILYDKSGTVLLSYPVGRMRETVIPSQTTEIAEKAFRNSVASSIVIPSSVNKIGERAFENCTALAEITIQGSPYIDSNAFLGCSNIENVTMLSSEPGLLALNNRQQAFIVSPGLIKDDNLQSLVYNQDLDRYVVKNKDSQLFMRSAYIPSGTYTVKVGILPNPQGLTSKFEIMIKGTSETGQEVYLFSEKLQMPPFDWYVDYESNKDVYDSVMIVERLVIPDSIKSVIPCVESGYYDNNERPELIFDRMFFEPVQDNNAPARSYAGPFVERVFNRATLHVPASALNAYTEAQGWKLFRNITSEPVTEVYDIITDSPQTAPVIHDLFGRTLSEPVPNSISIINGKKVYMAR